MRCSRGGTPRRSRKPTYLGSSSLQPDRPRALAIASELATAAALIVTTEEVLAEYPARERAAKNVELLQQDRRLRIIPQSHEFFQVGLLLYKARSDKAYRLTDCISMHTVRRWGVTEVLTNDRHFEQEGFTALFRS